jgi:hypothetical protein
MNSRENLKKRRAATHPVPIPQNGRLFHHVMHAEDKEHKATKRLSAQETFIQTS